MKKKLIKDVFHSSFCRFLDGNFHTLFLIALLMTLAYFIENKIYHYKDGLTIKTMTPSIQKIIEKYKEKLNFENGTIGSLYLQQLAEEIRQETLELKEIEDTKDKKIESGVGHMGGQGEVLFMFNTKN